MTVLWTLIRFGITALTSKDGQADKLKGTPGRVGGSVGQETVARYYPPGFDARPPPGGQAVLIAPGGGSNLVKVGERNEKFRPDFDDEQWTTILHNENAGTWVKLRKDGGVQVGGKGSLIELKANGTLKLTSSGGAQVELTGDVLKLNGGTTRANRQGDAVIPTTEFATWLAGLAAAAMYTTPPPTFAVTDGGNPKVTMT